jgi:glycosyltransferase involved in cell wall biosynthesis
VANTSWSLYNFRLGLIRRLQDEGYDISVIAPKDSFTSKLVSEGITYHEIDMSNYGTNPFSEIKLIYSFYKLYKKIDPDLIFHYTIKPNIYGTIAAGLCRKPSIIVTTGLGHLFQFSNFMVRMITLFLYRVAAILTKEVWFLNDNDRDIFIYKRIVRKSKTKVLKSEGVNVDWFKPRKDKKFYIDRFLFAGRLIWEKGVAEYVEAARIIKEKYPRVRFELLGFIDQSNPKAIPYEYISNWQKQKVIKYLGETTDIRPYLEKATCLVFPSYYREGVSRVLMEAASMETPIITTDNVGCRDIVDDGKNGFIVEPQNIPSLVKAIEEFIEMDDQDKLVMGKLGRKKMVEGYAEEKIIEQYISTITKYLTKQSLPKEPIPYGVKNSIDSKSAYNADKRNDRS